MKKIGKKLHKDRDEFLNFCKCHKRIIIYGAGKVAHEVFRYLEEEGIDVFSFCVSDGFKTKDQLLDRPILELGQIKFEENDGIILGVCERQQEKLIKNLQTVKFPASEIYAQHIWYSGLNDRNIYRLKKADISSEKYFHEFTALNDLGKQYGTDKSGDRHNYLNKYEFFLQKWRLDKIKILELGVLKGSSLNMWGHYFPNATVYGVDVMEECLSYAGDNRIVIVQDLSDEDVLDDLGNLHPQVIIDDASHLWSHQIKALYHLLPCVQDGGIYILEDLGTSFSAYGIGYADASISAYDFCMALSEAVTSGEFLQATNLSAGLFLLKEEIEFLAEQIAMMSFIHESCIIVKK